MYPILPLVHCRKHSEKRHWSLHPQTPSATEVVGEISSSKEKSSSGQLMCTAGCEVEGTVSCSFCWSHRSWRRILGEVRHRVSSVAVMPQLFLPSVLPLIDIVCHFPCAFVRRQLSSAHFYMTSQRPGDWWS